jgi:hypothetical protein
LTLKANVDAVIHAIIYWLKLLLLVKHLPRS